MPTTTRRFFTSDRVCALTLTVSTPDDLTEAEAAFYTPLVDTFEHSVESRLFPLAKTAYSECTDRRKRWRYAQWQAHFTLTRERDALVLCISSRGAVNVKEAHIWQDGVLARRKKLV